MVDLSWEFIPKCPGRKPAAGSHSASTSDRTESLQAAFGRISCRHEATQSDNAIDPEKMLKETLKRLIPALRHRPTVLRLHAWKDTIKGWPAMLRYRARKAP